MCRGALSTSMKTEGWGEGAIFFDSNQKGAEGRPHTGVKVSFVRNTLKNILSSEGTRLQPQTSDEVATTGEAEPGI